MRKLHWRCLKLAALKQYVASVEVRRTLLLLLKRCCSGRLLEMEKRIDEVFHDIEQVKITQALQTHTLQEHEQAIQVLQAEMRGRNTFEQPGEDTSQRVRSVRLHVRGSEHRGKKAEAACVL
jgi:hypothetical protein